MAGFTAVQSLASITAVVLCGGLGTRLRSVVAERPKALVEIHGQPFLAYLLEQLAAKVRYAVLCIGHLGEKIQDTFGDSYGKLKLAYSREPKQLGTAGAMRFALPLIKSESVLAMNGDSICAIDLEAFWTWHCARAAKASIVLTRVPDTSRYGRVQVEPDGCVLSFVEKGETRGAGWISAGIYLLSKELLHTIPVGRAVSIEREMFPAWVGQGLYGYLSGGQFIDIGTPESYSLAEQFLLLSERSEQTSLCRVGP